ncbi:MAG: glycosyltransferase [Candidatus Bathyarchaeia archaeon]
MNIKDRKPIVSIIIPTYNYGHFITEAIESVLAQTYKNLEIIVVDDGSTDNTHMIVQKYSSIICIRQNHKGVANAQNTGVKYSKGEFFLCLGADDILHPKYVECCLKEILQDEKIAFVWTATQEFGMSDRLRLPRIPHHKFSVLMGTGGQLGAALIRRKAYEDVGGFDESLGALEDWDFAIRVWMKGWKAKPILEPLHFARVHGQRVTTKVTKSGNKYYKLLQSKYPIIILYVPLARFFDFLILIVKNPKVAMGRLLKKLSDKT